MKLLFILLAATACFGQLEKQSTADSVRVCWDADSADSYEVYIRQLGDPTGWTLVKTSGWNAVWVTKRLGSYVFGVRSIKGTSKSEIHSSTDSTACRDSECGASTCNPAGGWYLTWIDEIDTPTGMKVSE